MSFPVSPTQSQNQEFCQNFRHFELLILWESCRRQI